MTATATQASGNRKPPDVAFPTSRARLTPYPASDGIDKLCENVGRLESKNAEARRVKDCGEQDRLYHDEVIPVMDALREVVDGMERICGRDFWPVPSYNKMLFWV